MQIDTKTVIWASAIAEILLLVQIPGLMVLLSQLLKGPFRRPPLKPVPSRPTHHGAVSVIVPTLNEVHRLAPCLEGLITQGREVREILVVDSHSTDGTRAQVQAYQTREPRLKLLSDPPLPAGWVGRPWALHYGFQQSSPESTWILGIDADTYPQPGLVAALLQAMLTEGFDLVSLAPQFILKTPGELWLQPALLMTLVYRFGPAGGRGGTAARVMANGQCFMARRALLERLEGYTSARASFCDDVTLARRAAQQAKVGFWDGSQVLKVQMYDGLGETWREWGRSLDLKDATSPAQVWWDCLFLLGVQGWPWVIGPLLAGTFWRAGGPQTPVLQLCLGVNLTLMLIRISMQFAIRPSYDLSMARSTWAFWLSPLADPLAVVRIALSSLTVPTQWRGRHYSRRQFR
jgi:dolichol-phosphate mannosyltransferase